MAAARGTPSESRAPTANCSLKKGLRGARRASAATSCFLAMRRTRRPHSGITSSPSTADRAALCARHLDGWRRGPDRAERYADRFDGVLSLCASDGAVPHIGDWFGDFFVAGAFAAGVTQQQFDRIEIGELINGTVIPSLAMIPRSALSSKRCTSHSAAVHARLQSRASAYRRRSSGSMRRQHRRWVFDNRTVAYEVESVPGVSADQFNTDVVRVKGGRLRDSFYRKQELTGDIKVPVLALHATGDANNPVREEKSIRRRIEAAGKGGLLVQHAVRSPVHCDLGAIYPALAGADQLGGAWAETSRPRRPRLRPIEPRCGAGIVTDSRAAP